MGRLEKTALFAFVIALVVSIGIHLPIWGALGLLAKVLKDDETEEPASVTVEFDLGEPTEPPEEEPEEPAESTEAESAAVAAATREESPRELSREDETPREEERDEEEEDAEEEEEIVAELEPAPPPEERRNLQAVQQRSQNPAVEAPDDARFIAEENSRVEEETVAELRNYQRDDVEQSPGEASEAEETEALGNDAEEEIADAREMEGSDQRTATEQEARTERPRESPDRMPSTVARGDTAREGGDSGGVAASGGGERERVVELNDGVGTFRIVVRERPEGSGQGEGGGDAVAGRGAGDRGLGARAGAPGTERQGDRGRGRGSSSSGPDLRVSWAQLEEIYTEEELREEREAWVEERQSRLRGSNRQEEWERFRAAIENFVPNVRPGNQTALNAAASPFANYLAHVHRRIHRQYADNFLRGLPAGGTSPFADRSLNTKLEIILNRDGTVHRIGIVKTSGFLPFDQGAFLAVMRAQPYPEAPSQILSGDGRVYFHWGFYRNERQCGTFNAEPYILPNPPGTPAAGGGPLRDRPERGGVIPRDARPSWGTDREQAPERPAPERREGDEPAPNEDGAPPPPAPDEEGALG